MHLQPAIKVIAVPGINVCAHVRHFFFPLSFLEPFSHFPRKQFAGTTNMPLISLTCFPRFHPFMSCGSLIFVRHRSQRCGAHAEKQPVGRGSICNQTERSSVKSQEEAASPMPVGRGSDDEEACLRHSTPPIGTLMQAACKPTPHMYLSVEG